MTPGWAAWLFPTWIATVITAGGACAFIAWQIAFDRGYEEADGQARHRHRIGDPTVELPRAGRLALDPLPAPLPELTPFPAPETEGEWSFFGAQVQPQAGPAEYELLTAPVMTQTTQTMTVTATTATVEMQPAGMRADETPSGWTRRQGEQLKRDLFAQDIGEMIAAAEQKRLEIVEESNYVQNVIQAAGAERRARSEGGAR